MNTITCKYRAHHPRARSTVLGTPSLTVPLRRSERETGDAELIDQQGQLVARAAVVPARLHGSAYALVCRELLASTGWQSATVVAFEGGRV
jgi:hypothetical protein